MKNLLRLLLFLCLCSPVAAADKAPMLGTGAFEIPDWFTQSFLDLREDIGEAAAAGKQLLLVFHQDACPYCAKLINTNLSQRAIVDYLQSHFSVVEINLWGARRVVDLDGTELTEAEFAKRHKVWFTPTLWFIDGKGASALRLNGYYPPEQFLTALRYVAEDRDQAPNFASYLAARAPAVSGGLRSEPFFAEPPHDLSGRQRLAVFFEQPDCPACVEMHEQFLADPETRTLLADFHVVQINRWSGEQLTIPSGQQMKAKAWGDQLGIQYLPAMLVFDQGKEIIRADAMLKRFHLQSMLDFVRSGGYREYAEFQRYIHARAEALREQGIAVDLWD